MSPATLTSDLLRATLASVARGHGIEPSLLGAAANARGLASPDAVRLATAEARGLLRRRLSTVAGVRWALLAAMQREIVRAEELARWEAQTLAAMEAAVAAAVRAA